MTALIGTLQLQLRDERQALQLMEAVLAGFREREKRIARALAALEGEHRSSGRPAAPKAGGKPPWTVMRR